MDAKKIKIIVGKQQTKDGARTFATYKAVQKDGHLIDCKFRKEVEKLPTKSCYMYVYPENYNKQTNVEYPILWVKKVERYEDLVIKTETGDEDLF